MPLPDGTQASSTASLYVIAYARSMLARDMIHHHDCQLLTVQKEALHIPLWGSLVFGAREVSAAHLTGVSALTTT